MPGPKRPGSAREALDGEAVERRWIFFFPGIRVLAGGSRMGPGHEMVDSQAGTAELFQFQFVEAAGMKDAGALLSMGHGEWRTWPTMMAPWPEAFGVPPTPLRSCRAAAP